MDSKMRRFVPARKLLNVDLLKLMVRWTPGSYDLIPAIWKTQTLDFIGHTVVFLLTVESGPEDSELQWAPAPMDLFPSVRPNTDFIGHAVFFIMLTVD